MIRHRRVVFAVVLLFATGHAVSQPPVPEPANLRGDSAQTGKRLIEANQKLAAGQTADAIDALQRVLDEAGDDLVTTDGKQFVPARRVAHQILARLPADALKGYQDRIDDPARKLLDAAKKTRDPAPLWQLLDRYFVSRPADEGSLLLGDLLFDRGEFRTAERVWRRLLPDAGADVIYPNSKTDPAAVRARLILAAIFEGETERAKKELTAFKAKHPGAKGAFAGKDGPYADALQAFLDHPPELRPSANAGTDWPTFGGGPDRSGRVGVRVSAYQPARPTWEKTLPSPTWRHENAASPPVNPPLGHPVIANGQVFVTDGQRVSGFDLVTGNRTADWSPAPTGLAAAQKAPGPCPSLTAAGDRLYVRVGPPLVHAPEPPKPGRTPEETFIVCLVPNRDKERELKQLWQLRPPAGEGKPPIAWEGAPLVAGRRLWAAYAKFEGGRVVHGIACYDPADATSSPPRLAWVADVCDSPLSTVGDGRPRQELVTLAGRNVVFCSNAGAVVALDSLTGRRAWAFRYPRARKSDAARSPDPSPAVACDGRVFVAPADAERVYALDPETGELLWESGPTEGAHILGVAAAKLIVAVAGPVRGLRGLNVETGSYSDGGWAVHNPGSPLSYGRGFVTDDLVVWPTRFGLFFLRPHKGGECIWTPHAGSQARYFGNVVYADGVMIVVTPTQVLGYVLDTRQFGGINERGERDRVRMKFEDLAAKAEALLAAGEVATAREPLLTIARGDFPVPLRAWAAARLLLLTSKTDDEAKLPADLQAVLRAELRAEWLLPPDGIPTTLGTLLDRHLGRQPPRRFIPTAPPVAAERNPEDSPTLAADAEIDRTLRLKSTSAPLRWLPGTDTPPKRLFFTSADELLTVSLGEGTECRHIATDRFTHAADIPEGFVAAGPLAVAIYAAGREPVWVFRVPTTEPLPSRPGELRIYSDEAPPTAELSAFRLTGSWLVARLGERHLIALDLKGRRVAWVLGTDGSPGFRPHTFPDAPRFGSEFFATGKRIVVQLSDGRRWSVRADNGELLDIPASDYPTAKAWWVLPPAEVEANRLAVSDGPGLVRMLNLVTGRVVWTHQEERESSLTGEPPQVRAWGASILIALRRNHGVELDRLDMGDGRSAWTSLGPAFLDADRVDLSAADADAERVYVPAGKTLAAFVLKDGKPAWEAELPDTHGVGEWVVKAGRKCVIVYPEAAIPREPVADVFGRLVRSFRSDPEAWRLPALGARLYDAWVARSVPVLLFDPETGKRLAKFDIPAAGPAVTACFVRDVAVVATGDRVCWLK